MKPAVPLSVSDGVRLQQLSKFEKIKELGTGASGAVWLVRNKVDG